MCLQIVKNFWSLASIFLLLNVGCKNIHSLEGSDSDSPSGIRKDINILEEVKQRKSLNCGVNGNLTGFSKIHTENFDFSGMGSSSEESEFRDKLDKNIKNNLFGFDVDICKAIAAAIFNDPEKVMYEYLDANERFNAISSREIDVLSRNTTWTPERDIPIKVEFAPVVFYDAQGILVGKDSEIKSLSDLDGKEVCVQTETTSPKNLEDEMKKRGLTVNIRPIQFQKELYKSYDEGDCASVSADRSQLAANISTLKNPKAHIILPEIISKEPLAPVVIDSDLEWIEIVRWIVFALIEAEELGISQSNLEKMKDSKDPKIIRFLGIEGNEDSIGSHLNLSPDFTQRIIKHVGNYGEIYERNFGPNSSTPIERGLNNLWNNPEERGLIYSPPFR